MAKKKKRAEPAPRSFNNNPFSDLKGLSVSGDEKGEKERISSPAPKRKKAAPDSDEETTDFIEAMEHLGVAPRDDVAGLSGRVGHHEDICPGKVEQEVDEVDDETLFLSSLEGFDTVFTDEIPGEKVDSAAPRRMKQLRQGQLVPEESLDLHGMSREQAREKVRWFLDNAVYHGKKTVLIITGRGHGSSGEPVLRGDMERYLDREAKAWVLEWGRAPKQYGGEGALVAFLKSRKKAGK